MTFGYKNKTNHTTYDTLLYAICFKRICVWFHGHVWVGRGRYTCRLHFLQTQRKWARWEVRGHVAMAADGLWHRRHFGWVLRWKQRENQYQTEKQPKPDRNHTVWPQTHIITVNQSESQTQSGAKSSGLVFIVNNRFDSTSNTQTLSIFLKHSVLLPFRDFHVYNVNIGLTAVCPWCYSVYESSSFTQKLLRWKYKCMMWKYKANIRRDEMTITALNLYT